MMNQTIPGQDELPQTFETSGDLLARPEWSVLEPRRTHPQTFTHETRVFYVEGTSTALEPGDSLLLVAAPGAGETDKHLVPLNVAAVVEDTEADQTRLVLAVGAEVSGYAVSSLAFSAPCLQFAGSSGITDSPLPAAMPLRAK